MNQLWLPPDGVRRASEAITVSASMLKGGDFRCPAADALKARGYRPTTNPPRTRERLEHFTLRPFMAACDARNGSAEFQGGRFGSRGAPLHDGLSRWSQHAVETYDGAFSGTSDPPLAEVRAPWAYRYCSPGDDPRGAREYSFRVWGRCLASADGKLRELRLPVYRMSRRSPPEGFVAAAALVLAEGTPGPPPERVRIVEFALLDGQVRQLFDGTRSEARLHYREHGREALTAMLDSQEYRPGDACTNCPYVAVCPVLRKAPGLLGVDAPGRPRRSWSVTNARSYRDCPARDHLRRLHLPPDEAIERDPSAERGRAVHDYLAERHGQNSARPCTVDVPEQWVPEGFDLPERERDLGAGLLRRHAAVCPLRCVRDGTDVRTEPRVVRHDTDADVIVIAKPDLLYRDGDSWVWRETKTTVTDRRSHRPLLERYPQLALAVLLIARGDLGGASHRARVELEILRPGGADLEVIDPFAAAHRATAERIVRELAADWHVDDDYTATPGRACGRCEVARWCSAAINEEVSS